MARVTVEDCLKHVENRFALVLKAADRAHKIEMGAVDPQVPADNDKPTVIALREIASGVDFSKLEQPVEEVVFEDTMIASAEVEPEAEIVPEAEALSDEAAPKAEASVETTREIKVEVDAQFQTPVEESSINPEQSEDKED